MRPIVVAALIVLALPCLYALYALKAHLGIDIFPRGGLHLYVPRAFLGRFIKGKRPSRSRGRGAGRGSGQRRGHTE